MQEACYAVKEKPFRTSNQRPIPSRWWQWSSLLSALRLRVACKPHATAWLNFSHL